jgi:AraC-like DNA-binding protein
MWMPIAEAGIRHMIDQTEHPTTIEQSAVDSIAGRFFVHPAQAFHFVAATRVIGDTTVALTTQSAFRLEQSPDWMPGMMHIAFMLNGSFSLAFGTHEAERFAEGSVFATERWHGVTIETDGATRGLDIALPLNRLTERGVRPRGGGFRIDGTNSLVGPLRSMALGIVNNSWKPTALSALVIERSIEDLVVGLLMENNGFVLENEDLRSELRVRALDLIQHHYSDVELSPRTLALLLGVSLRHLQRAFEGSGSSAALQINYCRADSAAMLLTVTGASSPTISDVAARCGFGSAPALRAGFKARYGVLPSDYREGLFDALGSAEPAGNRRPIRDLAPQDA